MRVANTYWWTYPPFPRGGGRGEGNFQMAVGSLDHCSQNTQAISEILQMITSQGEKGTMP